MSEDDRRYEAALDELGLEDVRPLYRDLLVRLKERDAGGYEEAVRRYREEVEPAVADATDPVRWWLRYGRWLADRLAPGTVVAVDGSGRSTELALEDDGADAVGAGSAAPEGSETAVPAGALLLHVPDEDREPALPLAVPAEPTVHQEATRELLCV